MGEGNESVVVRLVETAGRSHTGVSVRCAAKITGAKELNGLELMQDDAVLKDGVVVLDFSPYQIRTLALDIETGVITAYDFSQISVQLPYDTALTAALGHPSVETELYRYSEELWPTGVVSRGIAHELGDALDGALNGVSCCGQTIALPEGDYSTISILCASLKGDREVVFTIGESVCKATIADYMEPVARWDWKMDHPHSEDDAYLLEPGYIKTCQLRLGRQSLY